MLVTTEVGPWIASDPACHEDKYQGCRGLRHWPHREEEEKATARCLPFDSNRRHLYGGHEAEAQRRRFEVGVIVGVEFRTCDLYCP